MLWHFRKGNTIFTKFNLVRSKRQLNANNTGYYTLQNFRITINILI